MTRKWWNGLLVALLTLGLLTVSAFAQEKPGNGNGENGDSSVTETAPADDAMGMTQGTESESDDNANATSSSSTSAALADTEAQGDSDSEKALATTETDNDSICRSACQLLERADLLNTLSTQGAYTFFVPTKQAFSALGTDTLDALESDTSQLKDVLMHHLVNGKITSDKICEMDQVQAFDGAILVIKADDGSVTVGGAKVLAADIMNGDNVIHLIDSVIMPEQAADEDLSSPDADNPQMQKMDDTNE